MYFHSDCDRQTTMTSHAFVGSLSTDRPSSLEKRFVACELESGSKMAFEALEKQLSFYLLQALIAKIREVISISSCPPRPTVHATTISSSGDWLRWKGAKGMSHMIAPRRFWR